MNLIDLIFPPLCLSCKERCSTRYLCPDCWWLCEPPDPAERCRHCFDELDQRGTLCSQCRQEPRLSTVRAYVFDPESPARCLGLPAQAMAGFAVHQWIQLEWPLPEVVIPMPDSDSVTIGRAFAQMLQIPFIRALETGYTYKEERLEENQLCLLFDVSHSLLELKKATLALAASFPKRIFLLSLLPYVDHISYSTAYSDFPVSGG